MTDETQAALQARAEQLLEGTAPLPWQAVRLIHADTQEPMTPEQVGEYVRNSVLVHPDSAEFYAVVCEKPDGSADVCHVGNGPTSPANAAFIAAAPQLVRDLLATLLTRTGERDEAEQRIATWGVVELAVRNVNVSSYVEHWEGRALKAEAQCAALEQANEQLQVQLAGCSVASLSNTRESFAKAHECKQGDFGWSGSYNDVLAAVAREIVLREELHALQATVQRVREMIDRWAAQCESYDPDPSVQAARLGVLACVAAIREALAPVPQGVPPQELVGCGKLFGWLDAPCELQVGHGGACGFAEDSPAAPPTAKEQA